MIPTIRVPPDLRSYRRGVSRAARMVLNFSLAVLPAGCAGWRRIDLPPPELLPERQQVQLWQGNQSITLHSMMFSEDSVSGIPSHRQLTCEACRVGVPIAAVDSIRLGNREATGMVIGFAPVVALSVFGLVFALGYGSD
ncbi:MAG: hypothetical protein HKM89_02430 [Gemmatimonadales bacterium]|nr:hypothetical protein [Gemmatimonadales bacterium]